MFVKEWNNVMMGTPHPETDAALLALSSREVPELVRRMYRHHKEAAVAEVHLHHHSKALPISPILELLRKNSSASTAAVTDFWKQRPEKNVTTEHLTERHAVQNSVPFTSVEMAFLQKLAGKNAMMETRFPMTAAPVPASLILKL